MNKFNQFKQEVISRAEKVEACYDQLKRAKKSSNFQELCSVIKDNFFYCTLKKIIDVDLIQSYELRNYNIYVNENCRDGCVLVTDDNKITVHGSSEVWAYGSSEVVAFGSSKVRAYGSSEVIKHYSSIK